MVLLATPLMGSTTVYQSVDTLPEALQAPYSVVSDIDGLIDHNAEKYGVSAVLMRKIVHCESSGNPNAVGDNGYSYGLVQIHLPSHPQVTREQALNPEFALDFLAKNLSEGKGSMWTCYRMITSTVYN